MKAFWFTVGILFALYGGTVFAADPASLHALKTKTLEGAPVDLSAYKGKVVLVVNTASECGYTPQYAELQALHEERAKQDFVIVGFPSNDFGGQEPGDAKQIRFFCQSKYKVGFPMMEKVVTRGPAAHPVYKFLSSKHGEPKWNFHKYLIGKDGQVSAAFSSNVTPRSDELKAAISAELAKK